MIVELAVFMFIMILVYAMFTCVSLVAFGDSKNFQDVATVFIMYFQASLGAWDFSLYNDVELGRTAGVFFCIIFLLIMLVLFLNFLIAILSAVFTKYENSKTGLYYEVLVAKMPRYIFDPKYGSIVCASPPFNVLVWPFQWLTVCFDDSQNPKNSQILYWINNLLCHVIYLPFAVAGTLIYTFINALITPFAYIRHILRLVMSLGILKKRVARSQRIKTTIVFAIFAPLYLAAAVVLEFIVFFLYLYAKPRAMGGDTEGTPESS